MKNIEHIVYLMLENRSFDSVLGWLYENDKPRQMIPPSDKPFDGLQGGTYYNEDRSGTKFPASQIGIREGQQIPAVDPHEEFKHVQIQTANTNGNPMGGFYNDFATTTSKKPEEIMAAYTPGSLPVLNDLAKKFAVSDAYFSSIPTQTNCNRAFSLTGNSIGNYHDFSSERTAMVNNYWMKVDGALTPYDFTGKNVWNVLSENGFSSPEDWMIFYHNKWPTNLPGEYCFTEDLLWPTMSKQYFRHLPYRLPLYPDHFSDITDFMSKAESGNLPKFSFIEPACFFEEDGIGWNGNDYHPPGNVGCGEQFVHKLYNTLKSNPEAWAKTLLIINFDEHGGTYDHVTPPDTLAPWHNPVDGTLPPDDFDVPFSFTKLGVRVPLLLVSPLIDEKTVIRSATETPFDHTSVLATVLDHFGIAREKWQLGSRTANAPTFGDVITLTPQNARINIDIDSPLDNTCKPGKFHYPNELQHMIMHRYLIHTAKRNNYSRELLDKLYEGHIDQVNTMDDLNEMGKNILHTLKKRAPKLKLPTVSEAPDEVLQRELDRMSVLYKTELYEAIHKYLGPAVYDRDASLVACSDPQELQTVKKNFLEGKLNMPESDKLDELIEEVCTKMGQSNRHKNRTAFYYLLVVLLKKESVFLEG